MQNLCQKIGQKPTANNMAKLTITTEPLGGIVHMLGDSWTTLGRTEGNMFQINEQSVSSRHCEVKARGDELLVRDLNSTNGTFVGGMKVTEGIVKFGQSFRVGNVEVRFESSISTIPKVAVLDSGPAVPRAVIVLPTKKEEEVAKDVPKRHVLFVDDSNAFLDSFPRLCGELSGQSWEVHTAPTADAALATLEEHQIDLAVLDINMPMLDGIQLLSIVRRRYPHLKVAVMTGLATEGNRAAALANGAELFLEKPSDSAGIRLAFRMLNDTLQWSEHKEGFSGQLQQIKLPDVIQLQCLNKNSLILDIHNTQTQGQIYIQSGEVVHAAVGTLQGEQAFYQVLLMKGGQFQVKPFAAPAQRTIHGHWEILLMDAARASDEESDTSFHVKPADDATKTPLPKEMLDISLGADVIVAATYDGDGEWKSTGDGKK
jgi:CheY-like chemotaxis protein